MKRKRQVLQGGTELDGKLAPKEGRVELSAFMGIIWKKKDPSKMALPQGSQDLCFPPDTLRTAA